jgi:hypothetical protein
MKLIMVPDEFARLARAFHQDSLENSPSLDAWIDGALAHLTFDQKPVVKQFIDRLFAEGRSEIELQDMWNSLDSDYYIAGSHGMRSFLTAIRGRIE